MEKINALVIDPELESRMRLKHATSMLHNFDKLTQCASISEATQKIGTSDPFGIVFLSEKLEKNEALNFVKSSKQSPQSQDSAFVYLVKSQADMSTLVATNMLSGIDGFLCEPFSVDSLSEITVLAAKVKKERGEARELAAMRFLMTQIANQISKVAQLKAAGMDSIRENRKLTEMCSIFNNLSEETRQQYLNIAIEVFERAPIPKALPSVKAYGGVSNRVKRRLEDRVLKQIAGEETATPNPETK